MKIIERPVLFVILLVVVLGGIWYLQTTKSMPAQAPAAQEELDAISEVSSEEQDPFYDARKALLFDRAPELIGGQQWINAEPILIKELRGKKVVLIDFWTYSCINCIRTLPFLQEWHEKYAGKGLVIIGVHSPEFAFEKKYENVLDAVEMYGLTYPTVQDNDHVIWSAYQNRFWPHKYLIDKDGYIFYDHIGEGGYAATEEAIQQALEELGSSVGDMALSTIQETTPTTRNTPELYAGYEFALPRGQNIGNAGGLRDGQTFTYELPATLNQDVIYLEGSWLSHPEYLKAAGKSSIHLNYIAKAVNIVGDAMDGPVEMDVRIDGVYVTQEMAGKDVVFDGERAYVIVDQPRLYNLVAGDYERHVLRLTVDSDTFSFNAFTFG